ncbi:uncharacterized protein LOC117221202 isoform X2 [Megalopta genalis]|uniref:uncharacterized protein LOC117221202 isoform X2 n=1 Tax=Megalopta genalis TaxID=115081 RepID=UPI003FD18F5A
MPQLQIHGSQDVVEEKLRTLLEDGANTFMGLKWLRPELPDFFDEKKFLDGQRMFHNNVFTMMIAKLCGLLSLFAVPSIKNVLAFTKQSGTPCASFHRYVSTILHTWAWYGKRPEIERQFLDSLKIVRKKHCVAFRRSCEAGLSRVTQLDMALAQFGFMGFTLLAGDYLGVNNSSEELEGLIHFWRVVGSMLGMEDKFIQPVLGKRRGDPRPLQTRPGRRVPAVSCQREQRFQRDEPHPDERPVADDPVHGPGRVHRVHPDIGVRQRHQQQSLVEDRHVAPVPLRQIRPASSDDGAQVPAADHALVVLVLQGVLQRSDAVDHVPDRKPAVPGVLDLRHQEFLREHLQVPSDLNWPLRDASYPVIFYGNALRFSSYVRRVNARNARANTPVHSGVPNRRDCRAKRKGKKERENCSVDTVI